MKYWRKQLIFKIFVNIFSLSLKSLLSQWKRTITQYKAINICLDNFIFYKRKKWHDQKLYCRIYKAFNYKNMTCAAFLSYFARVCWWGWGGGIIDNKHTRKYIFWKFSCFISYNIYFCTRKHKSNLHTILLNKCKTNEILTNKLKFLSLNLKGTH